MKDKPVTRGPMPSIWGSWDASTKPRPHKRKDSPIMTEQRDLAVLEALRREKRDAISERAKEDAARIMAEHERRMGR